MFTFGPKKYRRSLGRLEVINIDGDADCKYETQAIKRIIHEAGHELSCFQ
jgi:hypothetical protein